MGYKHETFNQRIDKLKKMLGKWEDLSDFEKETLQLIHDADYVARIYNGIVTYAMARKTNDTIDMATLLALADYEDAPHFHNPPFVVGKTDAWSEQGMESVVWSVSDEEFPGYKSLHPIEDGDHLLITDDATGKVVFDEDVFWNDVGRNGGTRMPIGISAFFWNSLFQNWKVKRTAVLTKSELNLKQRQARHDEFYEKRQAYLRKAEEIRRAKEEENAQS